MTPEIRLREAFGVCSIREDTKLLARVAAEGPVGRALELGTGTGYVAIHLAAKGWQVDAVDVSARALALARHNIRNSGVHVRLFDADLYSATPGPYDLIVSNPPQHPHETELSRMVTSTLRRRPLVSNALQSLLRPLLERRRAEFLRAIVSGGLERLQRGGRLILVISPNEMAALLRHTAGLRCLVFRPIKSISGMGVATLSQSLAG